VGRSADWGGEAAKNGKKHKKGDKTMKTIYYSDGNGIPALVETFEELGYIVEPANNEVMGDVVKVTMTDEQWERFQKEQLELYWCGCITDTAEEHQKIFDDCM
jgi:hypothetical protein